MIAETVSIISFTAWLGKKIIDKGFDAINEKLTKKNDIDEKFVESIRFVANKLQKKYPDVLGNSISYFFTQEEVFDELCKLLFINQKVNAEVISKAFDNTTLPDGFIIEFINELKDKLSKEPTFLSIIADKELFIAVTGILKDVEEISLNSTLSLDNIIEIKKILEKQYRDKFDFERFKALYLKNLITIIGEINFIGLGIDPSIRKGKRKQLDSIFVKPFFKLSSKRHVDEEAKYNDDDEDKLSWHNEEQSIAFQHIFDRHYNYVILGSPGSGKSLLIKSIIFYISSKSRQFKNEEIFSYIPFRIELKNYLSYKKNRGGNLLKYLTYVLEDEYSVSSVLEENLVDVLTNEKAILFFDGLDEIFNVTDKISMKNDIEIFHNVFPRIKSITTSRYIGYNEAKLNEEKFCELNMLPFNEIQIKEYTSRWYVLEEENVENRNAEISDFISKMNRVDNELLSNPLLLSLIVILYRNNLKIPDSKLEIYQSCTNTLVDKWDASKNLDIQIDKMILQKKEPIFADLAFWQYETLSSSDIEITYYKAKKVVSESLLKKNVADEDNRAHLAEVFLNYAQKRSIYFDNNFTHKTFLEYYTAFWIYSNIEMKHNIVERNCIIEKYISNPFWFIVLELLLNMIDKDQPDSDILDEIVNVNLTNIESYPFLVYVIPNLKNISDDVQELVYYNSIKYLIDSTHSCVESKQKKQDLFGRIHINLAMSSQRNIFYNAITQIEEEYWNINFFILVNEIIFSPPKLNLEFDFMEMKKSVVYKAKLEKNSYLFQLDNFIRNEKSTQVDYLNIVIKYINLFGVVEFFKDCPSYYDSYYLSGIVHFYFYHQLKIENIFSIKSNLDKLEACSLETTSLIKFVLNGFFLVKIDKSSIQYLFDCIENGNDDNQKVLYLVLLKQFFLQRKFRGPADSMGIENFTMSKTTRNIMDTLVRTSNRKKTMDTIINSYRIKNKKVLQLTKVINDGSNNS